MKVLITGGSGFVGSSLVPLLTADGHHVKVLDKYNKPVFLDEEDFVQADMNNGTVRELIENTDVIIHLAAIVGYPACAREPELAWEVNYHSTEYINICRNIDQPIIFASSGTVYGPVDGICTEDLEPNPKTVYAKTKYLSEKALMDKGNATILRFSTGFGVSPKMRYDVIPNNFTRLAILGDLKVYQPDAMRSFVHVKDMARSFHFVVNNLDLMRDQIYNVGHESMNITKRDLALFLKTKMDFNLSFVEGEVDPEERDYFVNFEKLRKLGFNTMWNLEDGIDQLIEWFRNNEGWPKE